MLRHAREGEAAGAANGGARVWRRVDQPLRPLQAWLLAGATAVVVLIVYRRGPGQFLPAYTDPLRVRWLYADHRAGDVSLALRNYVRLRHATLDATIYELK